MGPGTPALSAIRGGKPSPRGDSWACTHKQDRMCAENPVAAPLAEWPPWPSPPPEPAARKLASGRLVPSQGYAAGWLVGWLARNSSSSRSVVVASFSSQTHPEAPFHSWMVRPGNVLHLTVGTCGPIDRGLRVGLRSCAGRGTQKETPGETPCRTDRWMAGLRMHAHCPPAAPPIPRRCLSTPCFKK